SRQLTLTGARDIQKPAKHCSHVRGDHYMTITSNIGKLGRNSFLTKYTCYTLRL
ncbi:hypothetical protein L9F63_010621, partial [Diploptera punctata]